MSALHDGYPETFDLNCGGHKVNFEFNSDCTISTRLKGYTRTLRFLSDREWKEKAMHVLMEYKSLNKIRKIDLGTAHRRIIDKAGGLRKVKELVESKS